MTRDPKLAVAERRLAAAKAEVDRWESFIRTYRELETGTPAGETKASIVRRTTSVSRKSGHRLEKSNKLTHTERVAATIIAEFGRPVPSPEMLRELIDRGVDIGGKEPASTLAARLSRAASIEFQRGLGWALRPKSNSEEAA